MNGTCPESVVIRAENDRNTAKSDKKYLGDAVKVKVEEADALKKPEETEEEKISDSLAKAVEKIAGEPGMTRI